MNEILTDLAQSSAAPAAGPACVSIGLRDADRRAWIAAICGAAGWRVGANGFLMLVDAGDNARAQAIRAHDPLVPIVGVGEGRIGGGRIGGGGIEGGTVNVIFDDILDWPIPVAAVEAMVAIWCPVRRAATLARLRGAFGDAEVDALVSGLLEEMRAALANPAPRLAHRIAGLAGTLGLADVARTWQRWSEGSRDAETPARRAALRALRDLG